MFWLFYRFLLSVKRFANLLSQPALGVYSNIQEQHDGTHWPSSASVQTASVLKGKIFVAFPAQDMDIYCCLCTN